MPSYPNVNFVQPNRAHVLNGVPPAKYGKGFKLEPTVPKPSSGLPAFGQKEKLSKASLFAMDFLNMKKRMENQATYQSGIQEYLNLNALQPNKQNYQSHHAASTQTESPERQQIIQNVQHTPASEIPRMQHVPHIPTPDSTTEIDRVSYRNVNLQQYTPPVSPPAPPAPPTPMEMEEDFEIIDDPASQGREQNSHPMVVSRQRARQTIPQEWIRTGGLRQNRFRPVPSTAPTPVHNPVSTQRNRSIPNEITPGGFAPSLLQAVPAPYIPQQPTVISRPNIPSQPGTGGTFSDQFGIIYTQSDSTAPSAEPHYGRIGARRPYLGAGRIDVLNPSTVRRRESEGDTRSTRRRIGGEFLGPGGVSILNNQNQDVVIPSSRRPYLGAGRIDVLNPSTVRRRESQGDTRSTRRRIGGFQGAGGIDVLNPQPAPRRPSGFQGAGGIDVLNPSTVRRRESQGDTRSTRRRIGGFQGAGGINVLNPEPTPPSPRNRNRRGFRGAGGHDILG